MVKTYFIEWLHNSWALVNIIAIPVMLYIVISSILKAIFKKNIKHHKYGKLIPIKTTMAGENTSILHRDFSFTFNKSLKYLSKKLILLIIIGGILITFIASNSIIDSYKTNPGFIAQIASIFLIYLLLRKVK